MHHQHREYIYNTNIKHPMYFQSSTNIGSASYMLAGVKLQPFITSPLVTVKVLCGIHNRCYESPTNLWCQPKYISNNIITRHVLRSYINLYKYISYNVLTLCRIPARIRCLNERHKGYIWLNPMSNTLWKISKWQLSKFNDNKTYSTVQFKTYKIYNRFTWPTEALEGHEQIY